MGKLVPRLDNVFGQALEIADANERAAFVERAGGGDETAPPQPLASFGGECRALGLPHLSKRAAADHVHRAVARRPGARENHAPEIGIKLGSAG